MTGFGGYRTTAVLWAILSIAPAVLCAQTAPAKAAPAVAVDALFADAAAKEAAVRKALSVAAPAPTTLRAVRTVVADFENVVRRYPTSSYSDDALWRAGQLAKDAFTIFRDPRERADALRLLQFLASQYPSSRFAKLVPAETAALGRTPVVAQAVPSPAPAPAAAAPSMPPAAPPVAPPLAPAAAANAPPRPNVTVAGQPVVETIAASAPADQQASPQLATIKAIRRASMKDVVRIVIELDMEVAFHDERLDNPSRVFIDLPATRANPSLIDQTLRFDADTDLVRQIRIGRHPNSTTRVVLEAAGVSSYSVYPLYSPYRLVIDCLRAEASVAGASQPAPAPIAPAAANVPPARAGATPPAAARPVARANAPATPAASLPSPSQAADAPTEEADRPSWVARLQSSAPLPAAPVTSVGTVAAAVSSAAAIAGPTIPARAVRWIAPMPRRTVRPLPAVAVTPAPVAAAPAPVQAAALPAAPAVPPTAAAPTPPSRNLAGGLSIARQLGLGVSRIVIDPGHGGHDPGAKGTGVTEAELVLDIALRLEKLLAKLQGVEVVLTRRDDRFIPLQERTAIANREGADLFLSIHANASNVPAARGVETYFLDFASNQGAAAVAARENATSGQTMGSLEDVVKAITLNNKLDESRDFATYVHREMLDTLRTSNKTLKDLGIKRAPFVVLIGASMPSVLAEVSFLTNPQENRLLKGSTYRQKIAQALFEGVKKYQHSLKTTPATTQQD